ncbi:hypothetical protein GFH48_06130 [Streptomyces fagopyri]|uniref:Uncharacterized protein n=1 Tax=Streptomyces fagopyri TaxID=2662397 RepID=A0A5Q0L777_9ACTN|nr:hypothetical protein [Streptomyces fagopyri]QFZ72902.1 hypothetical protein GFH48_06130 [Streptomyces fagopyri]
MLDHSEDRLLEEALGAIAGQGRLGAKFAARFLKHDVHEIELRLPLSFDLALERVRGSLVESTGGTDPSLLQSGTDRVALRVMSGAGFAAMNPVVVTVTVTRVEEESTGIRVRAAAKEGLIKQHAGEKTARLVASALEDRRG